MHTRQLQRVTNRPERHAEKPRRACLLHRWQRTRGRGAGCHSNERLCDNGAEGGLCNLSLKPSINLWMASPPARELRDDLDVHVVSRIPDICVPIMHWGESGPSCRTSQADRREAAAGRRRRRSEAV